MAWELNKKNKIYEVLKELLQYNISDIHFIEDHPVYVRNSTWDLIPQDIVFLKEELRWFIHDFLPSSKIDELIEWTEIDAAHSIWSTRLRINVYFDKYWIRLALRKISDKPPSMEKIWLDERLKSFLHEDKWLILVTWPTGSGKSTTLASMIDYINRTRKVHIITLEDPVEYVFENKNALITQREIGKHSKNWKDAMKFCLRQDPDIIMVWEMRDWETISAVLTLVETWHLVLSTLHTIDAAQTITRIIDVFPPYQQEQICVQLSLTLRAIISQRLLPTKDGNWRIAAREILVNSSAIANNIREKRIPQIISIMETWFKSWMRTMDQDLANLVAEWKVDLNYVLSRVKNVENFKSLLNSKLNETNKFRPVD